MARRYLNDSSSAPATGVSTATLHFFAPPTAGTYELRFYREAGGVPVMDALLTSVTLTVVSSTTLTLNGAPSPLTTAAGTRFTVEVSGGPANAGDWIAVFPANAQYHWQYVDRKFLNGQSSAPPTGQADAEVGFLAPVAPGNYEVRLYAANQYPQLNKATLVVSPTTAVLSVDGSAAPVTVAAGSAMTVSVTGGPGNRYDSVRLYTSAASYWWDYLALRYLNDSTSVPATGASTANLHFTAPPTPGTYVLRFLREAAGSPVSTEELLTDLTFTVATPTTLTVNDVQAPTAVTTPAGTRFSVGIANGPANAGDWIAVFPVGAQYHWQYVDRKFLNGENSPSTGQANATVEFLAPVDPGEYEVRFYTANQYPAVLTSPLVVSPTPATLSVNGSATQATVAAGAPITVSVSGAPANRRDSVRLYAPSAIYTWDYLALRYLNDTTSAPQTGSSNATLHFTAPPTAGTYELRFFREPAGVPEVDGLLTSITLTVVSPATLTVNGIAAPTPTTTPAGTRFTVGVTDGPANAGDWVAVFPADAQYHSQYIDRKFLNGQTSPPAVGMADATVEFLAPVAPGAYEVRFYAADQYPAVKTTPLTISLSPAVLSINGGTPPATVQPGTTLEVSVTGGPANRYDSVRLYTDTATYFWDYLALRYLNDSTTVPADGASTATLHFTAPSTPGTYIFRFLREAAGAPVATEALITSAVLSVAPMTQAEVPVISPPAGTYTTPQLVTMVSATTGAAIRYTLDGNEPTATSPLYSSGFIVDGTTTIKARGFASEFADSLVASTVLTITPGTLSTPVASPGSGWIQPSQTIALSADPGTEIRYTLDGTTPSATSTPYSAPFTIPAHNTTLKARAFRAGWATSNPSSDLYRFETAALRVLSFTPAAGAMGVRNQAISATFSAAMDPSSLTQSRITLESVLGEWTLYTTPSYDAPTRTVTLNVDDWIEPLALHRVRIVGGANGVRSASGMFLEADVEWTFTAASEDGVGGAWGFEEGAGPITADSSGNGNTGTLLGASWSAGRYSGGLAFDGVDDRIRIADAETLDASGEVSVAAWIKPSDVRPLAVILSKESVANDHSYALWLNSSGQLSANFVLSGGTFAATAPNAITTNVWTYVIATYDGSMIRLYVNGAEVASSSASGTFENTTRPLWIGGDQSASRYFAGHIDEVRVLDYAMAAWEISYFMSEPVKLVQSAGRVAGGEGHTLIAKSDRTVWAWGENGNGQLGDGGTGDRKSPYQVPGLSNIVAVAAGRSHSMALTGDGTAYVWGSSASGQIGADTAGADQLAPLALPLTSVKAIAAGDLFSLVLRANGEVYAFGRNADGQFGLGSTASVVNTPTLVATDALAIAAGFNHSVIVKADGTVWAAGKNDSGQLGNGSTTPSTSWVQMSNIAGGVAATAGERHTVVLLADGTLRAAGVNTSGQLGDNSTASLRTTAVPVYGLEDVTVIEAGANHTMATTIDGTAWTWGENTSGELGINSTAISRFPRWQPFYTTHIGAGYQHSVAVTPGGTVYTWGSNSHGQLGSGVASAVSQLTPLEISADAYAWRVATPAF
ncbi:MAG TPA: chitobiase/beta-hexosaminidase C-terminal domain-containing protein, partial [Vicinamibacterales bacterium]|nr:chitobiase/beta-hexosaminidase C-terminal domain-containing protein [Vicinamibacterales bacterium]